MKVSFRTFDMDWFLYVICALFLEALPILYDGGPVLAVLHRLGILFSWQSSIEYDQSLSILVLLIFYLLRNAPTWYFLSFNYFVESHASSQGSTTQWLANFFLGVRGLWCLLKPPTTWQLFICYPLSNSGLETKVLFIFRVFGRDGSWRPCLKPKRLPFLSDEIFWEIKKWFLSKFCVEPIAKHDIVGCSLGQTIDIERDLCCMILFEEVIAIFHFEDNWVFKNGIFYCDW